jgi:ribose 5-phosphate isomerase A
MLEEAKRNAAAEAVKHVQNGQIVGLGSGSTAAYAVEAIGARVRNEKLKIMAVPTSYQAFQLAVEHCIPVTTLEEHPIVDLTIDGADQIDPELNLIKGMGAALTREKIVAASTKHNIIVADETKKVFRLGQDNHPVPLEVVPFAIALVKRRIIESGGKPVLRESAGKLGPVVTDNGNIIIDAYFGIIEDPDALEKRLKMVPGVVETGIFTELAKTVYVGKVSGVEKLEKTSKKTRGP